ncbi:hypothetical protein BH11BAC3_BH11BAC3_33780 [soil metagenome]
MKYLISIKWSNGEKSLVLLTLFLFSCQILLSNTMAGQLGAIEQQENFLSFVNLGFNQFTSTGINRILFITSFFILCPKAEALIPQSFVFTASYLVAEWFTIHRFIEPNTYILNSLLLLSIFAIGLENILSRKLKIENSRYLLLFFAGLIHGSALGNELVNSGTSLSKPIATFFSYSLGLIAGEIVVLGVLFILFGKLLAEKPDYKKWIVNPISAALAIFSIYSIFRMLSLTN